MTETTWQVGQSVLLLNTACRLRHNKEQMRL